jgi:HK97 family phage prohead protease
MLHKLFDSPELKINSDGAGQISGYCSTFDNFDRVGEKPARGAFTPYLADFLKNGFIALGHDWASLPIGTPKEIREDDHGLWFAADFHSTNAAQEARLVAQERLARGKSVSTSIGYDVLDSELVDAPELPGKRGTLLKLIPLYEISMVTVPANPLALITGAKELLEAGGSFDTHALTVEATVRAFVKRAEARAEARTKEGRVLSGANREKLDSLRVSMADLIAIIEDLLEASTPAPKDDEKSLIRANWRRRRELEIADFLRSL